MSCPSIDKSRWTPTGTSRECTVLLVRRVSLPLHADCARVVLPDSQKSWISKAIFISDKIHESYYNHRTNETTAEKRGMDDWYLLSGTPATCAAIGIHHLCDRKPDLLLSGPNFGRNSSSIAALASGTIGAALEGAGAGVRGIAVSYAFWNRESKPEWVEAATSLTVRLAQHLYDNWDAGVDLYTINVPLCQELVDGKCQILKTHIHQGECPSILRSSRGMTDIGSTTLLPLPADFRRASR